MADINGRSGVNRLIIIAAVISLTLAVLAGIKFIMSDSSADMRPAAAEPQDIFSASEDDAPPPPELTPLSRSENPGGGSLDMFSKTNAGYYREEESTATVTAQDAPEPKIAGTAPAAVKKAAAAKPKAKTTAVPRMKMVPFKSITPTNVAPSNTGGQQGMPDLSTIMKQAQEQAGGTGSGD